MAKQIAARTIPFVLTTPVKVSVQSMESHYGAGGNYREGVPVLPAGQSIYYIGFYPDNAYIDYGNYLWWDRERSWAVPGAGYQL